MTREKVAIQERMWKAASEQHAKRMRETVHAFFSTRAHRRVLRFRRLAKHHLSPRFDVVGGVGARRKAPRSVSRNSGVSGCTAAATAFWSMSCCTQTRAAPACRARGGSKGARAKHVAVPQQRQRYSRRQPRTIGMGMLLRGGASRLRVVMCVEVTGRNWEPLDRRRAVRPTNWRVATAMSSAACG